MQNSVSGNSSKFSEIPYILPTQESDAKSGQPEQNSQNRTARKGHLNKTARTGKLNQDNQNRTARGQPDQDR
jgi:hypothetical protein